MNTHMDFASLYRDHAVSLRTWVSDSLSKHDAEKIPIASLKHPRLHDYFSSSFLEDSYVIYTENIPIYPFTSLAMPELNEMSIRSFLGITYLNCFFIRPDQKHNTALHFHELVHVIQWNWLGIDKFLLCYAYGLVTDGYRNSPLEEMAYSLEGRFRKGEIFDAISVVEEQMKQFDLLADRLSKNE